MISAKEAKKLSATNDVSANEQVEALLKSFQVKVDESTKLGKTATVATTFPWSQVSLEILKLSEEKLKKLGYKIHRTEHTAYKTFTISISWD